MNFIRRDRRHIHLARPRTGVGGQRLTPLPLALVIRPPPYERRNAVLGRREEQSERRRVHIAELNRRADESELRRKRLYDAIEAGVADLDDPALKERIAGLKIIRDQSRVDADRAQAMLESTGERAITPEMVGRLSEATRERLRLDGGGYRRDHLRALAQRVEVGDDEVRIMGSKSDLFRTLVAAQGGKSAAIGVPSRGPMWRSRRDSNKVRNLGANPLFHPLDSRGCTGTIPAQRASQPAWTQRPLGMPKGYGKAASVMAIEHPMDPASFGIGIYSAPEAARMVGMNVQTLRRWLTGYDHDAKRETPLWHPQYEPNDDDGVLEPSRVCRRLQLLRRWSLYEQDDEQVCA